MYVYCPVLMMMLLKWNVCCVGVVHYNETWEKKEREREEKTLEEKHKHIHITLAPIIGRFHSVLLTSHRCALSSTKKTREKKKARNEEMVMFFLDIHLFLSFTLTPLISYSLFSPLHTRAWLSSPSSMHILYVLFLMGNLITCIV